MHLEWVGVARFEARRRWVGRIRTGRVLGWSVERNDGALDAADAPPVYPLGACDALVVSHVPLADTPFPHR